MLSAFIIGLAGLELAPEEISFLRSARPCGVILFARNVAAPDQVRRLTASAAAAVGDEILVLIDQEGGRVRRLRPPHWRALPPACAYDNACGGDLDPSGRSCAGRRRGSPPPTCAPSASTPTARRCSMCRPPAATT